jgi:hypothetical protein
MGMRPVDDGLTPKEVALVRGIVSGLDKNHAAKEAGYSDWQKEADVVLARPAVRNELIRQLMRHAVSMKMLGAQAYATLSKTMAGFLAQTDEQRSALGVEKIAARDAISAANTVFGVLGRHNRTLLEAAEVEDSALDKVALAKAILNGEASPLVIPPGDPNGEEVNH